MSLNGHTGNASGKCGNPDLLSVHLESGPLAEAREPGTRRLGNVQHGRHRLEFFRRRAVQVEPAQALGRKVVRELTDLDLEDPALRIKHGCLHRYSLVPLRLSRFL